MVEAIIVAYRFYVNKVWYKAVRCCTLYGVYNMLKDSETTYIAFVA